MRRAAFLFLLSILFAFTTAAGPASAEPWYQPRKRLTIGGAMVDALAEFQRHGGQVDEILTPDDLYGKPPLVYGIQNGRSVFSISGGRDGGMAGLVTVDGSSVEASMTPDGFLELKPDQTGVRNRNISLYRALFPDQDVSEYTTEAVFEFIDESGKRLIFGGSEDGKTTAFLFKKDSATGEIVYKLRRDDAKNKEAKTGSWVDVDESSTYPVRIKICDENRSNCVVRNIIKKPGDEIRINPVTQAIKVTFNKDALPYQQKYGNAQRLSWACKYKGDGFYFTYREGFMGGDPRTLGPRFGSLTCDKNILTCSRSGPGQKCNFDFRDYLDRPHIMMLFGLNWLTSRLDPHKQHFTVTLDPAVEKHIRIKKFENLGSIRTAEPLLRPAAAGNDVSNRLYQTFKSSLCPDVGGSCAGEPAFTALNVTGVGEGMTLVDERTGVRLKNVTYAKVYVLRNNYGTGRRGDFVGAVVDNRSGGAEVSTLKHMEDRPQAPDLLDNKDQLPPEDVKAILAEMKKEEEAEVIQRTKLASSQRALVLFPARHGWGFASQPKGAKRVALGRRPARIMLMGPSEKKAPRLAPAYAQNNRGRGLTSRYASRSSSERAGRVSAPPTPYTQAPRERGFTSRYTSRSSSGRPGPVSAPPTSYTQAPRERGFTSRYASRASSQRQEPVSAPPTSYAEPYGDRGLTGRYASRASSQPPGPVSAPPTSYAARGEPAPYSPRPIYQTASADVATRRATEGMGNGEERRLVPLRLPIEEEELPAPVPVVRPTAYYPEVQTVPAPAKPPVVRPAVMRRPEHKPLKVTPALVREVQHRLKRQGYRIGRVDGRLGRETRRSIRRFQSDVSLKPTGRIDHPLLTSLNIDANNGWSERTVSKVRSTRRSTAKAWRPTKSQIKDVQKRLALIGFRSGPADGVFGAQTAKAVKRFQRQVGLKPTGRIDRQVLRRLSIKP